MRYLLFSTVFVFLYFSGCREIGPGIEIIPIDTSFTAIDTTYLDTIPLPENKRVLIEEATGVKCSFCPQGAELLQNMENVHKEAGDTSKSRVLVVGLHALSFAEPYNESNYHSKYDFRTVKGEFLIETYFEGDPLGKPSAVIDRIPDANNEYFVFRQTWQNLVSQRLSVSPPLNLSVISEMIDTNKAIITVNATYTQNISVPQKLTIFITESNIVDLQAFIDHKEFLYVHNHVFRDIITPNSGLSILDTFSTKVAGRVYIRSFKYTINPAWKKENCKIIAVVHNGATDSKAVLQAAETKLMP
jgi:hypothetical protein